MLCVWCVVCVRAPSPCLYGCVVVWCDTQSFTTSSCCAKTLDADGLPDFTDLDIKTTPGCNAPNAERIVQGLCAGKQTCGVRRCEVVSCLVLDT